MAVAVALLLWFQVRGGPTPNAREQAPAENRAVVDAGPLEVLNEDDGLLVHVGGAGASDAISVVAQHGGARIDAIRRGTNEFVFAEAPASPAMLVAWTTEAESAVGHFIGVSEVVQLDGSERRVSLQLQTVWPLEVELRRQGGDADEAADVGLRFPDPSSAAMWAQQVQFVTGRPAAWFLKTREADGRFRLPILPAQVSIRVSGTWGKFAGESSDLELTGPGHVVLELGELPAVRLIRVRDGTGAPVQAELSVLVVSDPAPGAEAGRRSIIASSGVDGLLEVPTEREDRLSVRVLDEKWAPEKHRYSLEPPAEILDIRVWPIASLRLRVQYDDGQPYLGMVYVMPEYPDLDPKFTEYVAWSGRMVDTEVPAIIDPAKEGRRSQFHEVLELERIPVGLPLTVKTTDSERVGYSTYETTVFALDVPREVLIVVPKVVKKNTTSRIRIVGDISDAPDCTVVIYRVSDWGLWTTTNTFNLGAARESGPVYPGRYHVRMTGASPWQSEEFELAPGILHDLFPEVAKPITVKARILDEAGLPIEGGTLDVATRGGPDFPATRVYGVVGVSDIEGKIELSGQPQGKSVFRLEALGFQPATVEVTLGAQHEVSLGEFNLLKATGEIHIRLPAADFAKVKVCASLADAAGPYRRESENATNDVIVFDGLPFGRTYAIAMFVSGNAESQKIFNLVRPTAEQPIIELDATELELPAK